MHNHHVTYLAPNAPAVWGDMFVYSQGVRIAFDSPFLDSRSLSKSGFLIYEGKISEIGSSVLDVMANAYEPLLERHIGKPVILEIRYPEGAPLTSSEFPGYLADYNEKFIALFNLDHKPEEAIEISARETTELAGCTLELAGHAVSIVCTGPDAIVVKCLVWDSEQMDMAAVLLAGQRFTFHRHSVERVQMTAARTRRLDLVCPRTRTQVRFTSATATPIREAWPGIAPALEGPSGQ